MPYARINVFEFSTAEERDKNAAKLRHNIKSVFPEIRVFVTKETSETAGLAISIDDDRGAADQALSQRDRHHENTGLIDIISHEGNIKNFYVEEPYLDLLLKTGS